MHYNEDNCYENCHLGGEGEGKGGGGGGRAVNHWLMVVVQLSVLVQSCVPSKWIFFQVEKYLFSFCLPSQRVKLFSKGLLSTDELQWL